MGVHSTYHVQDEEPRKDKQARKQVSKEAKKEKQYFYLKIQERV